MYDQKRASKEGMLPDELVLLGFVGSSWQVISWQVYYDIREGSKKGTSNVLCKAVR